MSDTTRTNLPTKPIYRATSIINPDQVRELLTKHFAIVIDYKRVDGLIHISESETGPFATTSVTMDELRLIRDWLNENL